MTLTFPCPYNKCTQQLECIVDTVGDPSVGLYPSGLESVNGTCIHAHAINEDLEEHGQDQVKILWSQFAALLEAHQLNQQYPGLEPDDPMEDLYNV